MENLQVREHPEHRILFSLVLAIAFGTLSLLTSCGFSGPINCPTQCCGLCAPGYCLEPASVPQVHLYSKILGAPPNIGDYWRYAEEREGIEDGNPFKLVGTLTVSILPNMSNHAGDNATTVASFFADFVEEGTQVSVFSTSQAYLSQGAEVSFLHGFLDDSEHPAVLRFVTLPPEGKITLFESSLVVGDAASVHVQYDDGTTERIEAAVAAIEEIDLPAGRFETLRIEGSASRTTDETVITEEFTMWFAPSLGAPVRVDDSRTIQNREDGSVTTVRSQSELIQTNVQF